MRPFLRTRVCRVVSTITAVTLFLTSVLSTVPTAFAVGTVSPPPPVGIAQNPPSDDRGALPSSAPSVVREMTDQAGTASRQFLLSNGNIRVEYYGQPVNYVDPQTGKMAAIDSNLQDSFVSGRAVSTNRANGFQLELPKKLSGDWVSIETSTTKVALRPAARAATRGLALAPQSGVAASSHTSTEVVYAGAFAGAALTYTSRPDGLKETIVVSAPTSSTTYSFDLSLAGLTPKAEDDGSISLFAPDEANVTLTIPRPVMWDASADGPGRAGGDVHYELSGDGPVYRLDVVADAAWLGDPARKYPVMIDPSLVTTTGFALDTYVTNQAGQADTNFSSSITGDISDHDPLTPTVTEYGLLQVGSAVASDMATKTSQGYAVAHATLQLRRYAAGTQNGVIQAQMCTTSVVIPTVTWNSRPAVTTDHQSSPVVWPQGYWTSWDITDMVSYWQSQSLPSSRCTVQMSQTTSGTSACWRSLEYGGGNEPYFTVDYAGVPHVTLTSPLSGSHIATTQATWSFDETRTAFPQARYRMEVAYPTTATVVATSEVAQTATSAQLPVPAGGWVSGQTYYVRVQAASSPTTMTPALWSAWSAWGDCVPNLDTTAPTTSSDATSSYSGTATISLTATDNVGGSGVANTYYAVDSFACTGGVQSTNGSMTVVTFKSSGSLICSGSLAGASMLIVAGGGSGGYARDRTSGGGGAGGLVSTSVILPSGSSTVVVGAGGSAGQHNGSSSSAFGVTAVGGGYGGSSTSNPPTAYVGSGGSGGGAMHNNVGGAGSGTPGQGNSGGSPGVDPGGYPGFSACGGGGAGAVGHAATSAHGGAGGAGLQYSISGTATYYAGGGGGGAQSYGGGTVYAGAGGSGGGGTGGVGGSGSAGAANSGGGGGGAASATNGGAGGSGIVIISYPTPPQVQSGTTITIAPPVSGAKEHRITFWSVDKAGNIEGAHEATLSVAHDATPPTTTSDAVSSYLGTAAISLTATDAGGSGVAATYYQVDSSPGFSATGGIQTTDGSSTVLTFKSSSSLVCSGSLQGASVLVVGGGGGGGYGTSGISYGSGGGGGGGQVRLDAAALSGSISVNVGSGGPGGTSLLGNGGPGGASSLAGVSASGGGYGGNGNMLIGEAGGNGACGGGAGNGNANGGVGSPGYNGGTANCAGAGGGGMGAAGAIGQVNGYGSNGGAGVSSSISGALTWLGSGGGGGGYWAAGIGGSGTGGSGTAYLSGVGPGAPGTANTGSGGGGGGYGNGGAGGTGVVIVRYTPSSRQAGTSITVAPPASGTATHTVYFWSVDMAGNIEVAHCATFTVTKPAPTASTRVSATTTESAWFTETDTNSDNANAGGRGSVVLSWPDVPDASSYNIYLLDGATYRRVGTSVSTTWTTAGAGLYPSDSQITSMAVNATGTPYLNGTGLDLRDDPTPLYAKMAGSTVSGVPAYFFKVTAANGGGEAALSAQTTVTVQLASRTKHANEDIAHTEYDLGSIAGDAAAVELDTGALTLTATDLSINSYGPTAELSRTYRSDVTSQTVFGAGWRFTFEQSITSEASGTRVYTDGAGERHRFTAAGDDTWAAPHSLVATLSWVPATSTYALFLKGGTVLSFNSTGCLTSELDRHGDATTYEWGVDSLAIRAANSHSILVSFSGGRVTGATYTTSSGTRQVEYPTRTSVVRHPSASETAEVDYSYDASRVASISLPGFAPGGVSAIWDVTYNVTHQFSRLHLPHPASIAERAIDVAYPQAGQASVSQPARVGLAASDTPVSRAFAFDPTGRVTSSSVPGAGSSDNLDYAPSGEPRHQVTAAGVVSDAVTDARGNTISSRDGEAHETTYTYSVADDLLNSVDPRGAITTYEYSARGDVLRVRSKLNESDWSETSYDYGDDTHGRVQSVTTAIDATNSAQVDYADYGVFAQPATVTYRSVVLSLGASGVDLTARRTFDDFGQLLTESDPAGVKVSDAAYDLSGRVVSVTDAAGSTTHHRYDVMDREVETSRTAGASWSDWASRTVDPSGLALAETSYVSSAGVLQAARTITYGYDGSGQKLTSDVSDQGRFKTTYDAKGDVAYSWTPSAGFRYSETTTAQTDPSFGVTTVTDVDGRITATQLADDETASIAYSADGDVAAVDPAGETTSTQTYDESGNEVSAAAPAEGNATVTVSATYDLGGRRLTSVDQKNVVTTFAYDLLGRCTSASLAGAGRATHTTYNALGWVLEATSPDGLLTRNEYDSCGRVTSSVKVAQQTGDALTTCAYDAAGRPALATNADSSSVETTYDPFGRVVGRIERDECGVEVHHFATGYDALGRALETSDTVAASRTTSRYATSTSGETKVTRSLGDSTVTVSYSASGVETTRVLTTGVGSAVATLGMGVGWRDAAGRPGIWFYDSGSASTEFLSVRDEAGRIKLQMGLTTAFYHYDPRSGRETSQSVDFVVSDYTYTADGRLATEHTQDEATRTYEYNPAGQITKSGDMSLDYVDGHLATSTVGSALTSYSFDDRGRRTAQISPDASSTFAWSASDRLTGYFLDRGRNGVDVTATYSYDASGQRTRSVVTSASVVTTTDYNWEGTSLARLTSKTGTQTTAINYLYDEMGVPTALTVSLPNTSTVYTLIAWTDARGDILSVCDFNKYTVASWAYDPYGRPLSSTIASTSLIPLDVGKALVTLQAVRYAGYVFDAESGLYYCSQRYYDPQTAQFISRDAIGADAQESAYQYCGGDPIGRTDPSGMRFVSGDESQASSYDSAVYAARHARQKKARQLYLEAVKARAEAQRERWRRIQAQRERAWKEMAARRKAAALAAMKAALAASEAEAAAWAEAARTDQYLAIGAGVVGVADLVVGAVGLASAVIGTGAVAVGEQVMEEAEGVADAAPEAANCFVRGTPILTATGLVPIDLVRRGDLVMSRDEHTGAQSLKRVVRTMMHQASELVHVRTDSDTITATPNHPFWVEGRGWVDAGQLASGDTLVLADGGSADIVSVTREKLESPDDVYNLEVEDYHTYFVAGAGVWVHNSCAIDIPEPTEPTPSTHPDEFEDIKHGAQQHVDTGKVFDLNPQQHGGPNYNVWNNVRSWANGAGARDYSVWLDGRFRK